jgi:hypothetical protein
MSLDHDRARVAELMRTGRAGEVDALLREMHVRYHDRPLDHVRVHRTWIAVHAARRRYLRALGHAFAGYVVAVPASLVQRFTGLTAFK